MRIWALEAANKHPGLICLGYFGSYARGDWGVGSDLDLIAVVEHTHESFERRPLAWDLSSLPVPADILIYTRDEWDALLYKAGKFPKTLRDETVWVYEKRQVDKPGEDPPGA